MLGSEDGRAQAAVVLLNTVFAFAARCFTSFRWWFLPLSW